MRGVRVRLARARGAAPAVRQVERLVSFAIIRASGLFDPAWYAAQFDDGTGPGRVPARSLRLAHYVWRGRAAGYSPHPLFEAAFFAPDHWRDDPADPFARFLLRGKARRRPPHPLFDPQEWARRHPEAGRHRFGPFAHFCATATPDTPLPLVEPLAQLPDALPLTWRRARAELTARVAAWRADERRRRAVRPASSFDPGRDARTVAAYAPPAAERHADPADPVVSVVMPVRDRAALVGDAIASVRAQTLAGWELIVVDDGSSDGTPDVVERLAAEDPRIRLVRGAAAGVCAARNAGAEQARGRYVAWLDSDNAWVPHFLATMVGALEAAGGRAAYAAAELAEAAGTRYRFLDPAGSREQALAWLEVSNYVDLNVLVVTRELLGEVDGFDETLRRTVDYDLLWRVTRVEVPRFVPFVGVRYSGDAGAADRITVREPPSWREVVKNRHLIDWTGLAAGAGDRPANRVSVLVGGTRGWSGAWRTATSALATAERGDEVVVVDDALPRGDGFVLAAMALADSRVRLLRTPRAGDRALATNLAFAASRGGTVLAAVEGVELWPGWREALPAALAEPGTVAAQPLLVAADGTVASAGATWPPDRELPAGLFAGLPPDDARRAGPAVHVRAAASEGAVAVRAADYALAMGLDPLYRSRWELTDLSLRLAAGPGERRVVVRTDVGAGAPPGEPSAGRPGVAGADDELFVERWTVAGPPAGDPQVWAAAGFAVTWPDGDGEPLLGPLPRPAGPPLPDWPDGVPSLRWAIKIAAPVGPVSRRWGDLHFARAVGAALERLGQQVVIDHRPAVQRDGLGLDDVVLVLRGLVAVTPPRDVTSLLWVISHPDLVTAAEAAAFDHVFAAGPLWASRFAATTGVPVRPLLQATDPALFRPEAAEADTGEPVLMVGNSRGVFRPVLRDLLAAGVDVAVHGAGWERFVDERHIRSRLVDNAELPRHYRSAGVVLNDHWDDMRAEGFYSNRLFDAAACGARVVSDHIDGIEELFGGLVRTFRTADELVALVKDAHDQFPDAAERAAAGARLGAEHSFDVRARELLTAALGASPR
jgi:hypothetical protein